MKKTILLDYRTSSLEQECLYKNGYASIKVPPSNTLYYAVCGHPDMLLNIIDSNTILVHKHMDKSFIKKLCLLNYKIELSTNNLELKYPYDIMLNGVQIGNFFIHNIKYSDPSLKQLLKDKLFLDVKQGYTKCSTAIISNSAAITSDIPIYNILMLNGIDTLLLPPKHISLPGLDYGFIGGTCGLLDEGTIAFFGDLNNYIYGKEVMSFLIKHDVKPIFLNNSYLVDRGSLFCI